MTDFHGLLGRNRVAPAVKGINDLVALSEPISGNDSDSAGLGINRREPQQAGDETGVADPTDLASSSAGGLDESGESGRDSGQSVLVLSIAANGLFETVSPLQSSSRTDVVSPRNARSIDQSDLTRMT